MKFYILAFLLLFTVFSFSLLSHSHPDPKTKAGIAKIIFRSTDGGKTWQDIGKELPENLRVDSIRGNSFFTNDKGLFLKIGNGLYHSTPNATAPFWTKEVFPGEHSSITPGKPGTFAWGVNLKTKGGTSVWSPIFDSSSVPRLRSAIETSGGAIFIGTDKGFFKTTDDGKTWRHVYDGGWAGHFAESNGVLVSTSKRRMIRSDDNGENWTLVNSEGDVTWDVKQVRGGFVALTSNSTSNIRRLKTSFDGGKTWQSTDAGLQDNVFIDSVQRTWNDRPHVQTFTTSIIQLGENFFCTHRHGIFKSSDKGKTWKLLLPSVGDKSFNIFVSGNVIYAIPSMGGC